MIIYCKALNNNVLCLHAKGSDTILDLKNMIHKQEGIPNDEQNLSFAGKHLANYQTVDHYNIKNESTIDLSLRLWGGGYLTAFEFLDVSKGLFQNIKLSPKAPKRCTIHEGINLSGICEYSKCPDKGLDVYCQINGNCYDFVKETNKVKCPTCDSVFKPKNVGFYKCFFTFGGRKFNSQTNQCELIERTSFTQNGEYKTFDEFSTEDKVKWIELKVIVDTTKTTGQTGLPL